MANPKAPDVVLTDDERETLERWARRPNSAQALALRCRIVLACAEGWTNVDVAEELGIDRNTVAKWRRRFVDARLDGLHDEPRPGAPPRSATTTWSGSSSRPWNSRRATPPTGRPGRWRQQPG